MSGSRAKTIARGSLLVLLALLSSCFLDSALSDAQAASQATPRVWVGQGRDRIKPTKWSTRPLGLFDETSYSGRKLKWRKWGRALTTGRGSITHCVTEYEPCHTYRGRIQFSRIVDFGACGGVSYPYYTKVRIWGHGRYTPWMVYLRC